MIQGFFTEKRLLEISKSFAGEKGEDLRVFDEPVYLSFVVTPEQRAEIEDALNQYNGKTMTEQLLCLIRKKK